jgi:enamine deaminase RidA (YjgF/YER057c/UK114 family)
MKQEATEVFELAKARLAAAGATLDNVAQLRAYVVAGANGVVAASEFEAVYNTTFNGDHKPALTILPVRALANDAKVEVEILAATLP